MTSLPSPRGRLSEAVFDRLVSRPGRDDLPPGLEAESEDDAAVTLWALQELSYRGFAEVDERWEQDPVWFGVRTRLESDLEAELCDRWPGPPVEIDLAGGFFDWVAEQDGPSLAKHVQNRATHGQVAELLCVRPLYHLKEADPTTWVIPRLSTAAQAALAELQYDEYGVGDPSRLHAHLWARGLESNGLSAEYGDHVDQTPTEVLVQNNALSLFGSSDD